MRHILSIIAALFVVFTANAQSDSLALADNGNVTEVAANIPNDALWEQGNKAYIDGDFSKAVELYSQIEARGYYSARLYYNLGNAFFKLGQLGEAILYYNRALVLSPSMEDAAHNLEIAEAQTKDKIAVVPQFFLNRWMQTIQRALSCTAWSVLSLLCLAVALALLLLFLLGSALSVRKVGFYGTVVALLLFVATISFAIAERNDILNREQAIVMSSAISVKSSPDRAATDLFVIHEGTKVTISSQVEGWAEVTIADGKKGWAELSHLERI